MSYETDIYSHEDPLLKLLEKEKRDTTKLEDTKHDTIRTTRNREVTDVVSKDLDPLKKETRLMALRLGLTTTEGSCCYLNQENGKCKVSHFVCNYHGRAFENGSDCGSKAYLSD